MTELLTLLGIITLPKNYTTLLSPHFNSNEVKCRCRTKACLETKIDYRVLRALEELRTSAGNIPLKINSGFRCEHHNKVVGGKDHSRHKLGMAVDIRGIKGMELKELAHRARMYFDYVLEYPEQGFIHCHFHPLDESTTHLAHR